METLKLKRPLERYRWEDNIKMGFKKVECDIVYWIHLVQDGQGRLCERSCIKYVIC
jgi:hypothetical protein